MSMIDNLKEFFMPSEEGEGDVSNMTKPVEEPAEDTVSNHTAGGYTRASSSAASAAPAYEETRERKNERYATIKATAQFQVVLVKATNYTTDSKKVADYLMQSKTVVLNLEAIDDAEKRRIIDFVVGAAYAMHGRIRPIANQTFLIIPQNVGFDGDSIVGELQDSGLV